MKKVTFYFVRHGETLFNREERMQGWSDSPLTKKGIEQAEQARLILQDKKIDKCFTSTSERCIDTAHIIVNERNIPVYYLKGLKEINFGTYEGARIKNHLEDIDYRRRETLDWSDIGGENNNQVLRRIRDIYDYIFDFCDNGDSVIIVSHGAIFIQMFEYFFDEKIDSYFAKTSKETNPVPNGYVGSFEREDNIYRIISFEKKNRD